MAVLGHEKEPQKKPIRSQEIKPQLIESPKAKSILIDTSYTPRINIITQIVGAPWKVVWYSQVLADDSQLQGHQVGKDALNQAYIKVNDFILRVTSPLSTSQEKDSNNFTVSGEANVYPFLKPNQGDMFVTDIGDGRQGLFRVTDVEEKSFYKEAAATINYVLVDYADGPAGAKRYADLEAKVIETRYFVLEFSNYNQNPYVTEEDYGNYRDFTEAYSEILDNYLRMFYSKVAKTILVPKQAKPTYDPFLVRFMLKAFDGNSNRRMINVKDFDLSQDPNIDCPTLWEALLDRDTDILRYITTMMTVVPSSAFSINAYLENIYYSTAEEVVYPLNPIGTADGACDGIRKQVSRLALCPSTDGTANEPFKGKYPVDVTFKDNYYIFTRHFYEKDIHMTWLEAQTWNYLEKKPVDIEVLKELVRQHHNWGTLEKFYYIPVLLLLIYSVIRGI